MLNGKVEKLEATVAQQQKQIETLTTQLNEQAAQIQKVSAQLEMSKAAAKGGREQTLAVVHHNYGIILCS